jgi:cbb3-type cytochrome oxidase subunit 1
MVEGNFSSVSGLLEACRFQHAYTTYKDVANILNLGAYRPSHTETVVAAADACGKNYSAFVVSQRGCQDKGVHSAHHASLVAFGFEVFPSCSG